MSTVKRIVILGSTGSIGTQTLDIVRRLPGRFELVGLAANGNVKLLAEQAIEFNVPYLSVGTDQGRVETLALLKAANKTAECLVGVEGMCVLGALPEADLVVVSVAGAIGIAPTHAALNAGKDIALASKEVLVAAGEPTMKLAKSRGMRTN